VRPCIARRVFCTARRRAYLGEPWPLPGRTRLCGSASPQQSPRFRPGSLAPRPGVRRAATVESPHFPAHENIKRWIEPTHVTGAARRYHPERLARPATHPRIHAQVFQLSRQPSADIPRARAKRRHTLLRDPSASGDLHRLRLHTTRTLSADNERAHRENLSRLGEAARWNLRDEVCKRVCRSVRDFPRRHATCSIAANLEGSNHRSSSSISSSAERERGRCTGASAMRSPFISTYFAHGLFCGPSASPLALIWCGAASVVSTLK